MVIPHQNVKDLEDVPKELLKRITVHPVHHYDELPPLVFETKGGHSGSASGKSGGKAGAKGKVEEPAGAAAKARTAKTGTPKTGAPKTGGRKRPAEAGA